MQSSVSRYGLRAPLRLRVARLGRTHRLLRRRLPPRVVASWIPPRRRLAKDARQFRLRTSLDDVSPASTKTSVLSVELSNDDHDDYTVITVQGKSKSGLLNSITSLFSDLGLEVMKAEIGNLDGQVFDKFFIVDDVTGEKLTDEKDTANVKKCIETLLSSRTKSTGDRTRPDFRQPEATSETLYTLMGEQPHSNVC